MGTEPEQKRRSYWLKTLHQWHWVSAAVCLVAMLGFSVTGFTLNHAGQIQARPTVVMHEVQLPAELLPKLAGHPTQDTAPLPEAVTDWLAGQLRTDLRGRAPEWSEGEVYVSLPRPGGDGWLSIDVETGRAQYETTDRGWIAYFNDLHKARNTGPLWSWFVDLFALACLVFSLTGLFLLYLHGRQRAMTWPLVALGLLLPFLIAIVFIH